MPVALRSYRERARTAPPWPLLANATLNLDFAHGLYTQAGKPRSLAGLLTVSRASPGYAVDSSSNWTTFGNNVARRTERGLLIEEARTNDVPNNSMQGAVVGTPGTRPTGWTLPATSNGLASQVVGFGALPSGQDYIDIRLSGTTSGTFFVFSFSGQGVGGIAAVVASVYTESFFAAVVGGSLANITSLSIDERWYTAAGAGISTSDTVFAPTATLTRFAAAATAPATTAFRAPSIALAFSSGVAIDVTLRVAWPQDELGAFETSPVRTTAAAATRAADVVTVTAPPTFGGSYTLIVRGTPNSPTANAATQVGISVDDGTNNNRSQLFRAAATANPSALGNTGGATFWNASTADVWAASSSKKLAAAFAPSDQAAVFGGGTPIVNASGTPFIATQVHIGSRADGAQQFNGFIESAVLLSTTRASNARLQSLTA